nr:MAG TPA: hypothetical protein [Caudoviricetes sp.]
MKGAPLQGSEYGRHQDEKVRLLHRSQKFEHLYRVQTAPVGSARSVACLIVSLLYAAELTVLVADQAFPTY